MTMFNPPVFPRKQQEPTVRAIGVALAPPSKDAEEARKAIGLLASTQIDFLKEQIRNMADQIKDLELLTPVEETIVAGTTAYSDTRMQMNAYEDYPVESSPYLEERAPSPYPVTQQVGEVSSGALNDALAILSTLPPEVVDRMAALLGLGVAADTDLRSPNKPVTQRTMVVASRQVPPSGWRY